MARPAKDWSQEQRIGRSWYEQPLRNRRSGVGTMRRVQSGLIALAAVLAAGTIGYLAFGFGFLDALYQTVTTVTTVGFREVEPFSGGEQLFTIALILVGVGTALYTLTVLLETLIEGHFLRHMEGRRMERTIARLHDHVIICGWGRVGKASAMQLASAGQKVVVVDRDPERIEDVPYPYVLGDTDEVLLAAGIERARALVAALADDADNVYATLSARALRPDLVIIARARSEESMPKLYRAGADEVVNPQLIGGRRMASFVLSHPTHERAAGQELS
jgi:voltage-gated potassium channel